MRPDFLTFVVTHGVVGSALSAAGAGVAALPGATDVSALSAVAGPTELVILTSTLGVVGAVTGAVGLLLELSC